MPSLSEAQIEQAKSVDVMGYLLSHESGNLKRQNGNRYILLDHDSLVVSNDKFYWFSRGVGGYNALDFLVKVRGVDFVDAVNTLINGDSKAVFHSGQSPPKITKPQQDKPFILPTANIHNDRVIAYLRGRGIDKDIIKRCTDNGSLYESRKHHNCIFMGFDGDKPKFACHRGTSDDFKQDVTGSNKQFSFCLPAISADSRNLVVCEAPADVLSHATIHKMNGDKWDGYRLSLDGVSSVGLISFLERNPRIEHVQLCLDADKAGKDATTRIIKELLNDKRFSHLKITVAPPVIGKDYSDTLQAIHQLNKAKSLTDRPKEAVSLF